MSQATAPVLGTALQPALKRGDVIPLHLAAQGTDPLLPIFATGTLRIGRNDYQWIKEAVRWYEKDATAGGSLWWPTNRRGDVTVARFYEGGDVITGDLLWFDTGHFCFQLLMNAFPAESFDLIEVEVTTSTGIQEANAFAYRHTPWGFRVPTGDWPV